MRIAKLHPAKFYARDHEWKRRLPAAASPKLASEIANCPFKTDCKKAPERRSGAFFIGVINDGTVAKVSSN
ncbi:hypothetical protein QA644_06610 [Rhizobium sp. CC1099]|uniref:hypothetical protein n=1 Tax=Rhizobium sp. CC1099 TaxID=3039160 RepID=UPI0024B225D1|nr:hypothetical protein [Rhizobium sp. CC1099]WFU88730.1 hypothetical protein QA644_06610 [Rhizobium sp. CC1099]